MMRIKLKIIEKKGHSQIIKFFLLLLVMMSLVSCGSNAPGSISRQLRAPQIQNPGSPNPDSNLGDPELPDFRGIVRSASGAVNQVGPSSISNSDQLVSVTNIMGQVVFNNAEKLYYTYLSQSDTASDFYENNLVSYDFSDTPVVTYNVSVSNFYRTESYTRLYPPLSPIIGHNGHLYTVVRQTQSDLEDLSHTGEGRDLYGHAVIKSFEDLGTSFNLRWSCDQLNADVLSDPYIDGDNRIWVLTNSGTSQELVVLTDGEALGISNCAVLGRAAVDLPSNYHLGLRLPPTVESEIAYIPSKTSDFGFVRAYDTSVSPQWSFYNGLESGDLNSDFFNEGQGDADITVNNQRFFMVEPGVSYNTIDSLTVSGVSVDDTYVYVVFVRRFENASPFFPDYRSKLIVLNKSTGAYVSSTAIDTTNPRSGNGFSFSTGLVVRETSSGTRQLYFGLKNSLGNGSFFSYEFDGTGFTKVLEETINSGDFFTSNYIFSQSPVIDSSGTVYMSVTSTEENKAKVFYMDTSNNIVEQDFNDLPGSRSSFVSLKYDLRIYDGAVYIVSPYGLYKVN